MPRVLRSCVARRPGSAVARLRRVRAVVAPTEATSDRSTLGTPKNFARYLLVLEKFVLKEKYILRKRNAYLGAENI